MHASPVAARGVVLIRQNAPLPSAIVTQADAERMKRRFGGVIVPASGLRYRRINGSRVVLASELPELKRRYEALRAEVAA